MKKGFTLIELLAVILILGIIALIAVPTVSKVIKESKRGAFKSSSQNIVMAVEQKCQLEQLKGEQITKYYRIEDGVSPTNLDIKGELPSDGSIIVDDECNVNLIVNKENYIAVKNINDDQVTIIEDKYYKPGESVKYNPGDSNYTNWYVLKDNGNTVTLLLSKSVGAQNEKFTSWCSPSDYLNAGGVIDETLNLPISSEFGPISAINFLNTKTSTWNSEAKANIRLLDVEDILELFGINDWDGKQLYFDTKSSVAPTINGVSENAWLFDNLYTCINYGCNVESSDYNYWLSGVYPEDLRYVYMVNRDGSLSTSTNFNKSGGIYVAGQSSVRPVITIGKEHLSN